MKTKIIIALLWAIVFIIQKIYSTNPIEKTGIWFESESKSLIVKIPVEKVEEVTISLQNTEGVNFYSEKLKSDIMIAKKFNLKNFDLGAYQLIVKRATNRTIQPIEINANGIKILEDKMTVTYSPYLNQKGHNLFISAFSNDNPKVVVKIYDKQGYLIFNTTYKEHVFQKCYSFKYAERGFYTIEVLTNSNDYTFYTVDVK